MWSEKQSQLTDEFEVDPNEGLNLKYKDRDDIDIDLLEKEGIDNIDEMEEDDLIEYTKEARDAMDGEWNDFDEDGTPLDEEDDDNYRTTGELLDELDDFDEELREELEDELFENDDDDEDY